MKFWPIVLFLVSLCVDLSVGEHSIEQNAQVRVSSTTTDSTKSNTILDHESAGQSLNDRREGNNLVLASRANSNKIVETGDSANRMLSLHKTTDNNIEDSGSSVSNQMVANDNVERSALEVKGNLERSAAAAEGSTETSKLTKTSPLAEQATSLESGSNTAKDNDESGRDLREASMHIIYPDHVEPYATSLGNIKPDEPTRKQNPTQPPHLQSDSSATTGSSQDGYSAPSITYSSANDSTRNQATASGLHSNGDFSATTDGSSYDRSPGSSNEAMLYSSGSSSNSNTGAMGTNSFMASSAVATDENSSKSAGNLRGTTNGVVGENAEEGAEAARCRPLSPQEKNVQPAWISSFPGSGSKLIWQLTEGITGIFTGDDYDSSGRVAKRVAVAIKTHYPSHTEERVFRQGIFNGISRALLVLRNPMHALPALFRFVYYIERKKPRSGDSAHPPVSAWVTWRNENFGMEIKAWAAHAQWWLDNYKRENLHLLPFEYLTSPERGSNELQKMGNFLASADPTIASSLVAPEQFCCIWDVLVKHNDGMDTDRAEGDKFVHSPYTAQQLEYMIQALIKLRDNNKSFPEFFQLMDEYLGEIVDQKKSLKST